VSARASAEAYLTVMCVSVFKTMWF